MQFLKSSTQEEKEITALNKYKLFILLLISKIIYTFAEINTISFISLFGISESVAYSNPYTISFLRSENFVKKAKRFLQFSLLCFQKGIKVSKRYFSQLYTY